MSNRMLSFTEFNSLGMKELLIKLIIQKKKEVNQLKEEIKTLKERLI